MKIIERTGSTQKAILPIVLVATILGILFFKSFFPDYVHFSNDGPLGAENANWIKLPQALSGQWDDLNSIGFSGGMALPDFSGLLFWLLGPIGYSKFLAPISLFILGWGAWVFFRRLELSPLAAIFGALAAVLNSAFFSDACWGTASHQIAFGMDFFALALIVSNSNKTPLLLYWIRLMLAGLCIGINVMEAADIGALCSLCIAGFVFFKALVEPNGIILTRALRGVGRVIIIAIFASFIAIQAITSLIGTQIQGVAGTAQDEQTKIANWDKATQWSLPKMETLSLIVPGLYGYRMDTPKDILPMFQESYQGGLYWGGMGRTPEIDRFLDGGGQGQMPPGFMRFSGGGSYCGILVWIVACWAVAQSFRRKKSLFSDDQKKMIWFWGLVLIISLPLAWGRFAPVSQTSNGFLFYALLYKLPYFSTIRNPAKFLIFLSWAVVVLFAYGIHALNRRYLDAATAKPMGMFDQLKCWWTVADKFDRKLLVIMLGALGASVLGWLIYSSQKPGLVQFLENMGFPDADTAQQIAAFSIDQVGWFLLLFAVALIIITLIISGYFSGHRSKYAMLLLGGFLIFDLGRANLPYIIHWDIKQKYEVGALNPIVTFLSEKPYEHRVAGLPFHAPEGLELLDQLYRIEWMQHLFLYNNIQCLDIIQMPRMAEDLKSYLEALSPRSTADSVPLIARHWELTNTRYLLGPAGFLDVMNQQLDPEKHRFRIVERFEIVPKPGIARPMRLEELTAVPNENGRYALFDFTGALPRAKLYSNWQVNTNDPDVLKTLADLNFDPQKTVLVDAPELDLPTVSTNENSGTVEYKSYSPTDIVLATQAGSPSILLLNDKFDPNWQVNVDGKTANLIRCNYLMRGVYLPAGNHTVEFHFRLSHKLLYVTLAALALAVFLSTLLIYLTQKTHNLSIQ